MDSFFGIGIGELFFIAIIALIVLGPERLPGAIREVAKWSRTIRNLSGELTSQFSEEMKAFDDINPQKILRELTEEPLEEINKTTGATKPAAKPAVKLAAKTTPAKPATPPATKPATTPPATGTAATGAVAKTTSGITSTKNITPPPPKKRDVPKVVPEATDSDAAGAPESDSALQAEAEKRILPPTADEPAADQEAPALEATEKAASSAPPAAEQPGNDEPPVNKPENKIVADATAPHAAIAVNGKSASAGEDA